MIFYNVFMCMCVGVIKKIKERERELYLNSTNSLFTYTYPLCTNKTEITICN